MSAIEFGPRSEIGGRFFEDGGLGICVKVSLDRHEERLLQLTSWADCIRMDSVRSIIQGNLPCELADSSF